MNTAAATTQATYDPETAGADVVAEHFATATPAELMQTMLSLGTLFFQASEAFDKAMQRRHQLAAQQAVEVLMPDPAPAPSVPSVPAAVVSTPAAPSVPSVLDADDVGTYSRLITLFEQTNGYINQGIKELYWSAAGLPGLPAFANGGVFSNGIVTRPTAFDIGLMGEAGDEAIMPLSRMPNGQLGVAAYSGGRDSSAAVVAELRELRTELQNLRAETRATAINTGRLEQLTKRVTRNGEAMQTVVAA